ncbi:MAG: hypothetical protein AB7N76_04445 [Planctomycetota bacterium]
MWGLAVVLFLIGSFAEPLAAWLDPDLAPTLRYLAAPGGTPPSDLVEHFLTASFVRFAAKLQGLACFLVWGVYAPWLVLDRTPRSERLSVELGRAAILASFPCLLAVFVALRVAGPIAAREQVDAGPLLLVPLPYALAGTFCALCALWALWVRLGHRPEHRP